MCSWGPGGGTLQLSHSQSINGPAWLSLVTVHLEWPELYECLRQQQHRAHSKPAGRPPTAPGLPLCAGRVLPGPAGEQSGGCCGAAAGGAGHAAGGVHLGDTRQLAVGAPAGALPRLGGQVSAQAPCTCWPLPHVVLDM